MATVLLVLHLMIAAALVGVVLLQKSEGGALGMGGGGGGGFMTGRGTASMLTRVTAGLAAAFFITSITLTLLAQQSTRQNSPLDVRPPAGKSGPATPAAPKDGAPATTPATPATAPATKDQPPGGNLLDSLQKGRQLLPQVPKSQ